MGFKKTLNTIANKLMLSCEKSTELITKKSYQKLSLIENMQLKSHLMFCKFCNRFAEQNSFIDSELKKFHNHNEIMDSEKKNELSTKIEKELGE